MERFDADKDGKISKNEFLKEITPKFWHFLKIFLFNIFINFIYFIEKFK